MSAASARLPTTSVKRRRPIFLPRQSYDTASVSGARASPPGIHACGKPTVLEAIDLTVVAPDGGKLVDGVSLSIEAGERLAIVGPNGAGKTSLLRALSGQRKPDHGRISVGGRDLARMPSDERARLMAVVAQSDTPDSRLTVADYVGLGRIPHSGRCSASRHRAIIAEALARVGLDTLSLRQLGTLSGGEKQRAAIARAVSQQPSILLLDEPTNHLDLRARTDVLDIVRRLGITVIAVLHDLALVNAFADHVAVMREGAMVAHGPVERALAPAIVRDVFSMNCFSFKRPDNGRPVLVFEAPLI